MKVKKEVEIEGGVESADDGIASLLNNVAVIEVQQNGNVIASADGKSKILDTGLRAAIHRTCAGIRSAHVRENEEAKTVTVDDVLRRNPCYHESRMREIYAGRERWTALQIIQEIGPKFAIPASDLLWTVMHESLIDSRGMRLLACAFAESALLAERAAGREPDARSFAAIEASRKFARGEATAEDLAAAWEAAWSAAESAAAVAGPEAAEDLAAAWSARSAAWSAARSAAGAALSEALSAAREAAKMAWSAAESAQLVLVVDYLTNGIK